MFATLLTAKGYHKRVIIEEDERVINDDQGMQDLTRLPFDYILQLIMILGNPPNTAFPERIL